MNQPRLCAGDDEIGKSIRVEVSTGHISRGRRVHAPGSGAALTIILDDPGPSSTGEDELSLAVTIQVDHLTGERTCPVG